jgi:hypothetical protein
MFRHACVDQEVNKKREATSFAKNVQESTLIKKNRIE